MYTSLEIRMAKRDGVWAIDENGKPCKCYAKPENRGKRNCKHRAHQEPGQDTSEFFKENGIEFKGAISEDSDEHDQDIKESITEDEINSLASRIDEICGTHVTEDNYNDVIASLSPEQLDKLNKVGFEAAPSFSLPITDEMYDEVNTSNKIYFAELPEYNIGGKKTAMTDMFGSIGPVPSYDGDYDIEHNYRDGLTQREYFERQFSTRGSQIAKTVSVSKPGAVARRVFYGLSDVEVIDDCGASKYSTGILTCRAPGVCKACAAKSGWKINSGQLAGGIISTHLTEGLTQASLNAIHTGEGKKQDWEVIADTLQSYKSSPIIMKAREQKTTKDAREVIFNGLKESYANAGISIDDYNLMVIAKQLTSYKNDKDGSIRYVKDDEMCDFPSIQTIGGHNNLFLQSELKNSYQKLTRPGVFKNEHNAVTSIAD